MSIEGTCSDFIVYVDESGDHELIKYNRSFPVFVLTFCVVKKSDYMSQIVPGLQALKFKYFGHDMVVLHERDIVKKTGPFSFLNSSAANDEFMADLNGWVESSEFKIIAVVIRKPALILRPELTMNPYHIATLYGLERVYRYLARRNQASKTTHFVFESRGAKEDAELKVEFDKACAGENYKKEQFPFQLVMAPKKHNSTGLQLADLTARPVGLHVIDSAKSNRAYQVVEKKMDRNSEGVVHGYGLKCFP